MDRRFKRVLLICVGIGVVIWLIHAAATAQEVKHAPTAKNAALDRCNNCPLFSIATNVFSKVAGCGLSAIACISLRCSAMPASIAG